MTRFSGIPSLRRTPDKPNIIGETGPQPVWGMDGAWRWDDVQGLGLEERKLVLGFAAANTGILHWDWSRRRGLTASCGVTVHTSCGWMRSPGSGRLPVQRSRTHRNRFAPTWRLSCRSRFSSPRSGAGDWRFKQNAVRALYNYARGSAVAAGEYQLGRMPQAKLIIVPAPWVMRQESWDLLMGRVRAGATLSGVGEDRRGRTLEGCSGTNEGLEHGIPSRGDDGEGGTGDVAWRKRQAQLQRGQDNVCRNRDAGRRADVRRDHARCRPHTLLCGSP